MKAALSYTPPRYFWLATQGDVGQWREVRENSMRSIAVMNQKGGVGKTTTAVNLSAALSKAGKRVFVIDLDPQAHASLHLGIVVRDGEASMYDVLTGDRQFRDVRQQVGENLYLAPA